MAFEASRLCIAFDAGGVCAARVTAGLARLRVRAAARVPLGEGALVPRPADANLVDAGAVTRALARALEALGDVQPGAPARVVLPDGLARPIVLDPPRGVAREEFARFRLVPGLPYPGEEAQIGLLALGGRRVLATALRRAVVAEYEASARAAGVVPEGVFLAPLAALSGLLRQKLGAGVAVILGDAALSLAALGAGGVRAYRCRRREVGSGEIERLLAEVERTAALAGDGAGRLTVVGSGARRVCEALAASGQAAELGRVTRADLPESATEWAWLEAAA